MVKEIKKLRKSRGLSQMELAERLERSQAFVSRLEADNMVPSDETLKRLCEVLQCRPKDLGFRVVRVAVVRKL